MASLLQLLRRIGGAKASPTSGQAGELAVWKAGNKPLDAFTIFLHDGVQWIEVINSPGGSSVTPHITTSETAPPSPAPGAFWYRGSTKELAAWDGVQWSNVAFKNVTNTFTQGQVIDVTDANAALHVKQKGTGPAAHIEVPSDPNAVVVDNAGNIGLGEVPTSDFKLRLAGAVRALKAVLAGTSPEIDFYPTAGTVDRRAFRIEAINDELRFVGIKDDGTQVTLPLKLQWSNGRLFCETVEVSDGHVYIKSQRAGNADFTLEAPKADGSTGGEWLFSCHADNGFEIYNSVRKTALLQVIGDGRFRLMNAAGNPCLESDTSGWLAFGDVGNPKLPFDFKGAQANNIVDATATGALDMEAGNNFKIDATAPVKVSIAKMHSARAYHATLRVKNGLGKVTWTNDIKWPGGTPPTLTAGVDLFEFYSDDPYNAWYGKLVGSYA